jgi:hypothetical protein
MASIGTLFGILTLKSGDYERKMTRCERLTNSFRSAALKMGAQLLSVQAAWQLMNKAIQHGSALTDAAEQTRTTVEGFQVLGAAARDAGAKQEQLRQALIKVNANAELAAQGNAELKRHFDVLGISVGKFVALPTERKMEALGRGLVNAKDQSAAFLAVSKILGEDAGPRMIEVLRRLGTEGLDPMAKSLQKTNLFVSQIDAQQLDKIADTFGRWANNLVVATAKVVPWIDKTIDAWTRFVPQGILARKVLEDWMQGQGALDLPTNDPAAEVAREAAEKLALQKRQAAEALALTEEVHEVWQSMLSDEDRIFQAILDLEGLRNRLERAGQLSPFASQTIDAKIAQLKTEMDALGKKSNEVADQIGLTFTSAFEDAVIEGRKLGDVIDGIAKDLIRLFVRQSITQPLFNWFSGLFAGGRADGGPVSAGKTYLVGERGPEIFTAPTTGTIVPNHKLAAVGSGGGDVVHVHNHFASGVTRQEVAALIPRIVDASVTASVDARRRRKPGFR